MDLTPHSSSQGEAYLDVAANDNFGGFSDGSSDDEEV
jgi:hypothetical protein